MEPLRAIAAVAIISALVLGAIIGIPYFVARLTQPAWATFKSLIEFAVIAFVIGIFLRIFGLPAGYASGYGVPAAFAIAFIRYKQRVARYENSVRENGGNGNAGHREEAEQNQE